MTLAPDFGILAQAYRMPFRFPMTAVRIFWPFILVYELGSQAMAHSANATNAL